MLGKWMCYHGGGGEEQQQLRSPHLSLSLSLSSRLPNLQQLWPKVEGEGELVATDTDIEEGSNGSRLVTAEGGRCDGKRMVRWVSRLERMAQCHGRYSGGLRDSFNA
jgi:hypothetical protein